MPPGFSAATVAALACRTLFALASSALRVASSAACHVVASSQSKGGVAERDARRTSCPAADRRAATRRPVLPAPPITAKRVGAEVEAVVMTSIKRRLGETFHSYGSQIHANPSSVEPMDPLDRLLEGPRALGAFLLRVVMEPPWSMDAGAVRDEKANRIYLEDGAPIRFGEDGAKGVVQDADGSARVVDVADVGEDALLVHDASHREPSLAFALSRVTFDTDGAVPFGVFRRVERPVYDDLMAEQLASAKQRAGEGDLEALLHSGDTWVVPGSG